MGHKGLCLFTSWRSGNPSRNEEFCFSRASRAVVLTVGSLPERLSDSGEPPVLSKAPVGSTAALLLRAQRWGRLCECEAGRQAGCQFTPHLLQLKDVSLVFNGGLWFLDGKGGGGKRGGGGKDWWSRLQKVGRAFRIYLEGNVFVLLKN